MKEQNNDVKIEHSARLAVLEYSVSEQREAFKEISTAVKEISKAIQGIRSTEERRQEDKEVITRIFSEIADIKKEALEEAMKMAAVQLELPPLKETRAWIISGVLAVVGIELLKAIFVG